jgi:two-component system response regulator AtoC
MARVFVIDDNFDKFADTLRHALGDHDLTFYSNGKTAIDRMAAGQPVDAVLLDIGMPPQLGDDHSREGIEVLKHIKQAYPDLPVIMLTVYSDVDTIIDAIHEGAFYYLTKPPDLEKLNTWLDRALENSRLRHDVAALEEAVQVRDTVRKRSRRTASSGAFGSMIGESPAMRTLFAEMEVVSELNVRVLLSGETGTGKDIAAREIHRQSSRCDGPYIPLNCAALPETLLESELFGHEKGAFTGAVDRREGKFELANGGMLFLDEIGDMPLSIQAKLLRVLENGEVWRLGAPGPIYVDVRVICASNRDLADAVAAGEFREDLFYRINVYPLEMPPLRERSGDVRLLARHLLEHSETPVSISDEALDRLADHQWPGNVRELQNVILRATAKSRGGDIKPEHITFTGRIPHAEKSPPDTLWQDIVSGAKPITDLTEFRNAYGEDTMRDIFRRALRQEDDIKGAARLIGYPVDDDAKKYDGLRQWMKRLKISRKSARQD